MIASNSKTGALIVGTAEQVSGVAYTVPDSFHTNANGGVMFEHAGTTDIHWNDQKTLKHGGETIFVDSDGAHVMESMVVLEEA